MKVSVKDLAQLVREIAQDEIKKQLPSMIKECLTEVYLKRIVSEQVAPRRPALRETLEDEIPEPQNPVADDHPGIYHKDNPMVRPTNEVASKLLSRDNPLSFIYEGTKPIASSPVSPAAGDAAPPVEQLAAAGFDFSHMNKLVKGMEKKALEQKVVPNTENAKLRELEERRKALEVKPPSVK